MRWRHERRRRPKDRVRYTADKSVLSAGAEFFNQEYFVITYRTDREALEKVVPEPLVFTDPIVKYEFIRMPDLDRLR